MLCTSTAAGEAALGTVTAGEDNLERGRDQSEKTVELTINIRKEF
jgi:hypothetical protein